MALFSRRPKKGVIRKGRFNDTIPVYTAPSGTQYVMPSDVLRPTPEQFDKLLDNVYKKMKCERATQP